MFSRRKFLKSGLLAAGGITVSSGVSGREFKEEKNIIYRTLGKTGLTVPVIGMGVMIADNPNLVRAAIDQGITFFDTAHSYQNGRNEEMLGKVFRDYPRDSFYISTKIGPAGVNRAVGLPTRETTSKDFLSKFDLSLKRLGMEYVDILYLHLVNTPEMVNFKPLIRAMQQLRKEGRARFIGISTHKLPSVIDAVVKAGHWDVIETTYNFLNTELIRQNAEPPVHGMEEALQKAGDAGLGVVAMKALAGGGFLDKERTKPINASAAIKWVLSNPNVHIVIPGMTTFDHLDTDIKLLEDIALTEQEEKDIFIARAETGLFCKSCDNCIPECRFNLPIPEIMRAYMYAYGYSNLQLAHALLTDLAVGDNPCRLCDECTSACSMNFNIREKITDIARLVNVPPDFIV
ncbi:MAG: oxidoreductase [Bacteroidales bacterium]|jgi:predicted aldo/keto reductase-like oxidoreductase|nr:oxidoreductase [Bacteroidales bacterium]